jgi:hypothetical protein
MPTIDGVLKDWGDRILPDEVHGRRPRNLRGGRRPSAKKPGSKVGLRGRLALTVKKAPEVLVKVSGGGRNAGAIRAHFDYISRHGKLDLEDENGTLAHGRDEIHDVLKGWTRSYGRIPEAGDNRRQAFNIVLSMPPGTSRAGVKEAARAFAAAEFGGNHSYVFTEHADEAHPHVHLVVKAMGRDGVRLNPKKRDLQRWRERFADALHVQGIVANATPRQARGIGRRGPKQALVHMRDRGAATNKSPMRPAAVRPQLSAPVAQAFKSVEQALAASPRAEDLVLAHQVAGFVAAAAPVQTPDEERPQTLAVAAEQRDDVTPDKGAGRE